jgi:hypothetical protein
VNFFKGVEHFLACHMTSHNHSLNYFVAMAHYQLEFRRRKYPDRLATLSPKQGMVSRAYKKIKKTLK